jgi:general secretion pathway protein I
MMWPSTGFPAVLRWWNRMRACARRPAGFTLVEVLVALAVMAAAVPIVFQAFHGALHGVRLVDKYGVATLLAESKLASLSAEGPLEEAVRSGRFANGFTWTARVQPFLAEPPAVHDHLPFRPYEVTVTVRFDDRREDRSVSLTTLRLDGRR